MTKAPTHLYHGTTGDVARCALTEGLRPRNETGAASNWDHTVSSNGDQVYMTACYAPYFAMTAQPEGTPTEDQRWGVLEIDLTRLDANELLPDEDFLEQGSRGVTMDWCEGLGDCTTMKERTVWFRSNLWLFQKTWPDSIEYLGTASHFGAIPPEAISRAGIFTPTKDAVPIMHSVCDPTVSLMNYKFMSDRYNALARWFVGDTITPAEFYGELSWPSMKEHVPPDSLRDLDRVLSTHPGLEVIKS